MNTLKPAALAIAATLAVTAATAVNAEQLLSRSHYDNELNRCVAQIRVELNADPAAELAHRVTAVAKEGAWYKFTIETAVGADLETATTHCAAHRFNEVTRLQIDQLRDAAVRVASS